MSENFFENIKAQKKQLEINNFPTVDLKKYNSRTPENRLSKRTLANFNDYLEENEHTILEEANEEIEEMDSILKNLSFFEKKKKIESLKVLVAFIVKNLVIVKISDVSLNFIEELKNLDFLNRLHEFLIFFIEFLK